MTYTIQKPQGKVFALPVRLLNLKPEEYVVREMKKDPFYHLTANVEEADADESAEVLRAIEGTVRRRIEHCFSQAFRRTT